MAIIKCPECGHQISDRAPVCPSCGVEIAGKISKCKNCGEIILKEQSTCPHCGMSQAVTPPPIRPAAQQTVPPVPRQSQQGATSVQGGDSKQGKQGKSRKTLLIALVISAMICGICYYFYNNAQNDRRQEAYEIAMKSDDPLLLENFLNTYANAPQEQIDSVSSRLAMLRKGDEEWMNTLVANSKSALEDYMNNHPDSPHNSEALHKIDSIDWNNATGINTLESYKEYMDEHATGEHIDECKEAIATLNSKTVQPEEKEAIATLFRHFFQSINSRNEEGLGSTVTTFLSSFLGKTDATMSDVITFMHKIYKEDITNMNWRLNNDWNIEKKDVGGNQYEYTVTFTATQDIDRTDASKERHAKYNIKATIGTEGKISSMNMVKVLE